MRFTKSFSIRHVLMLSVLIVLGPFLHAHYGASWEAGLHMPGFSAVSGLATHELHTGDFNQDQDQKHESAAAGVETSYPRQASLDFQDQPQTALILIAFVVAALSQLMIAFLFMPDTQRAGRPLFLAGFPTLPHAPPISRL